MLQKIKNGDPSYAVDVTRSVNALQQKKAKKKNAQARSNAAYRGKKQEQEVDLMDIDPDVTYLLFQNGVSFALFSFLNLTLINFLF